MLQSQISDIATLFMCKRCSIQAQETPSWNCLFMPRQAVEDHAMRNISMRALAHSSCDDFAMLN